MSIRQAQQIDPSSLSYRKSMPTHLSFFAHSCCVIRHAPRAQSDRRSWTSYALVIPAPCQSLFSKMLGRTLTGKSTCSSTCSLIRHSTSVCPLNTQESFPYPQPRRTFRYLTSKLSFTMLFMVYSFTFPISERPHLLITPRKMTHSRSEAVVVEGSDSYRGEPCWDAELHRGLRCLLAKIINDDTQESAHRQRESKFTTVRSKAVGISLWRLLV